MLENTKERPLAESSSRSIPCISNLKFPFKLTKDQSEAVEAWISNKCRGSIIYSTGTGKTEIAFECARRRAEEKLHHSNVSRSSLNNNNDSTCHYHSIIPSLLFLVPRIVLVEQNFKRLLSYNVPKESIGVYFGERKEIREITISTYQSIINNLGLIHNSDMIIFDEMHLLTDSAITLSKMFCVLKEKEKEQDSTYKKALLGLTATIDEE